ncbi:MAG: pentapeptide repeat-containing protein [Fimbriimonadaceae bacterium]|nr:pentapeptide repeat-containing protein [Fimbriimonadaceae bacterium]
MSEKPKGWFERNRQYVAWGVAAFLVGTGGMLGLLSLAGITSLPVPVTILDKAAQGHVVTAAVSWFAGTIALYTFYININQKERQHAALLGQERHLDLSRERRERDLAELLRLEEEFKALADDFAQPETLARINAAIGLGELAQRADPRREEDGRVLPDPREDGAQTAFGTDGKLLDEPVPWPDEWRSLKTERNYPYFLRAAHRLAAALHQWDDAARSQALRVLREMGDWAKDEKTDEPLLHALCNALAEANRDAWAQLRDWAAVCLASETAPDDLANLLGLTEPEGGREETARKAFLADLRDGLEGSATAVAFEAVPPDQKKPKGELENRFFLSGKGWLATRDALATALRTLSAAPDSGPAEGLRVPEAQLLSERRSLDLAFVRMFQADCTRAHFEGADCTRAHFEGARCFEAHFEGADCTGAHFEGARCTGARFEGARCFEAHFEGTGCFEAHFEGARCFEAHFEGANCTRAHFEGADCTWANFEGANCTGANFEGANCTGANFEGAGCTGARFNSNSRLASAQMGQRSGSETIQGTLDSWESADFRHWTFNDDTQAWAPTEEYDQELWNFLNTRLPVAAGQSARVPPWEAGGGTDAGDGAEPG